MHQLSMDHSAADMNALKVQLRKYTEKRMFVLSWYTALVTLVVSTSFSTEQLSPMEFKQ